MTGVQITGSLPARTDEIVAEEARAAAKRAGDLAVAAMRANIHRGPSSQHLADSIVRVVTRSARGVSVRVGPRPALRQKAVWVDQGTGTYREYHAPIRGAARGGKRGALKTPWGPRASVKGQPAQHFVAKTELAVELQVEATLAAGVQRAAVRLS